MARTIAKRAGGAEEPTAEDELNNRLFFRLFQARNIYERKAQLELGFSGIQGALLGALSNGPADGIPLSDLVEYLAVSRQNLDGVLKRLEKQQLVERVEDASNRRSKVVRITRAGKRAWDALFARTLVFYRQGTRGISLEAKQDLAETLGRMNRSLRTIKLDDDQAGNGAYRAVGSRATVVPPSRRRPERKTPVLKK